MPYLTSERIALLSGDTGPVGQAISLALTRAGVNRVITFNGSTGPAQVIEQITAEFGRLDILVNLAPPWQPIPFSALSLADWQHTLASQAYAPLQLARAALPLMRVQARSASPAHLIHRLDPSFLHPEKAQTHHAVGQAMLWSLTQNLALELAPEIRVNAICTGPILTSEQMNRAQGTALGQHNAADWQTKLQDIADTVLFLCESNYITGQMIVL